MKINLLIATLIITCLNVFGQAKPKYGTPEYNIGRHFTLDTSAFNVRMFTQYGVANFVNDYKLDNQYYTDYTNPKKPDRKLNIKYRDSKDYQSSYDSLKNVVFVCEKAGSFNDQVSYLLLNSPKTGPVYYVFKYDFGNFIVPNFELKCVEDLDAEKAEADADNKEFEAMKNNPCTGITSDYNKIDRAKEFTTPMYGGGMTFNCAFSKSIQNGVPSYTLYLSTKSQTPLATEKGVVVLLKNGKRISKPAAKVKTEVDEVSGYLRSSVIILTQADIAILKTSPIDTYRLYIDDDSPDNEEALYKMFLCLLTKK